MQKYFKNKLSLLVLHYLRFWARLQLRKNPSATIIGITGSAGKTSTRLALVKILEQRGIVKHSVHANSESGIPLNILGLSIANYTFFSWLRVMLLAPIRYATYYEKYRYYIVEMGIDSPHPPKNMDYLLSIVKPHLAIILGVSHTHTEGFDSLVTDRDPTRRSRKLLTLIAKEKMKLATSLDSDGVAIINQDNVILAKLASSLRCRKLSFGVSNSSNVKLSPPKITSSGFHTKLTYQSHTYNLDLPDIFGEEYGHAFAAAATAALSLGISLDKSIKALASYRAPAGRMRVFAGVRGSHIIDSSYNSSPTTVKSSLSLLSSVGNKSYKIAVLGDMRELGSLTKSAHQSLANDIMQNSDEAVLYGESTAKFTLPILERSSFKVHHFSKMPDLINYLRASIKPDSWILVKASQNKNFLERAVQGLLKDPTQQALLPRRGKYWDQKRSTTP